MKKISYILISVFIFSLITFSGLFLSCELENDLQEAVVKDPGVQKITGENIGGEKGIEVSIYNVTDTKYINIYRQDISSEENPGEIINIGMIFPEQFQPHSWVYQDYYVYREKKYKYCVKYTTKDGTYKSGWSKPITVNSAYETTTIFKYTVPEESYFEYNEKDYTITLKGNNIGTAGIPDDILSTVQPCLVISNDENKKTTYPFRDVNPDTYEIEINSVMWLRSIVEPEYTNRPIKIEGIVFEKEIYGESDADEEKTLRRVSWGVISNKIPIQDDLGRQIDTITIKSTTADGGFDYSD